LLDLIGSLQGLNELGVGFVSLSEALDLTTASGRALAGMLAVFAEFERDILRDRVKAGIAQARRREQKRDCQAPEHQPNLGPVFTRVVAAQMAPGGTSVG
jgi:DNA invertase Pin-like site-specific DNA recombinase